MRFNINNIPTANNYKMARTGLKNPKYNAMLFPGNGSGMNPMTMQGMKDDVQYYGLSNGQIVDSGIARAGQNSFNVLGDSVLEYRLPKNKTQNNKTEMNNRRKFQNSGFSDEEYGMWLNRTQHPQFNPNTLVDGPVTDTSNSYLRYMAFLQEQENRNQLPGRPEPIQPNFEYNFNWNVPNRGGQRPVYKYDPATNSINTKDNSSGWKVPTNEDLNALDLNAGLMNLEQRINNFGSNPNTNNNTQNKVSQVFNNPLPSNQGTGNIANTFNTNALNYNPFQPAVNMSKDLVGGLYNWGKGVYNQLPSIDFEAANNAANKTKKSSSGNGKANSGAKQSSMVNEPGKGIPVDYNYQGRSFNTADFTNPSKQNTVGQVNNIGQGNTPSSQLVYTDGSWKKLPGGTMFSTYHPEQARMNSVNNSIDELRKDQQANFAERDRRFSTANERQQRRKEQLSDEVSKLRGLKSGIRDTKFDTRTDKIESNKQRKISNLEDRLINAEKTKVYQEDYLGNRNRYQNSRNTDISNDRDAKRQIQYANAGNKFNIKNIERGQEQIDIINRSRAQEADAIRKNNPISNIPVFQDGSFSQYGRNVNPSFNGPEKFQLQQFQLPEITDARMMQTLNDRHGAGLAAGRTSNIMGDFQYGNDPSFSMNFNERNPQGLNLTDGKTVSNGNFPSDSTNPDILSSPTVYNEASIGRGNSGFMGLDRGTTTQLAGEFLPAIYNLGQSFIPAKVEKPVYNKYSAEVLHDMQKQRYNPDFTRLDALTNAQQAALRNTSANPAAVRANRLALANQQQMRSGELELQAQRFNQDLASKASQFKYGVGAERAAEDKRVNAINDSNELARQNIQDLAFTQFGTGLVDLGKHLSNYDMTKFEWDTMSQIYDQYGLAAFDDVMSGKVNPQDMIKFREEDPEGFDAMMQELQYKKNDTANSNPQVNNSGMGNMGSKGMS